MRRFLLALLVACSSPARVQEPAAPDPELSRALVPLARWVGTWQDANTTEHWVAAGGALYGVSFHGSDFEVMVIDDGDRPDVADGVLRMWAMPGGAKSVEFRQHALDDDSVMFANRAHDAPKTITYSVEGSKLVAALDGKVVQQLQRGSRERAPALEAADRAFSADTGKRGVAGWMAAFDSNGGMIRKGKRIEGTAIAEMMTPLLSGGTLKWEPIASGAHGKELGFTVGKARFTGATPSDHWESSYVTIWRKQPDGSWKVLFDTGRPVQKAS